MRGREYEKRRERRIEREEERTRREDN